MTNQQKLQTLRNLTGPSLYSVIIKELGPGTIHIPLDDGIPESRNLKIRAEFNSPEFEEKPLEVIYRTLAERHNLSTRQIRRILNKHTSVQGNLGRLCFLKLSFQSNTISCDNFCVYVTLCTRYSDFVGRICYNL